MMSCDAAIEITIDITVTGNPGGPFDWTFHRTDTGDPSVTVGGKGYLDFSKSGKPIHVKATVHDASDPSLVFYKGGGINVFGFADSYGDGYHTVSVVAPGHYQIGDVQLSNGNTTVSFCYANQRKADEPNQPGHYAISRYTMYLGDSTSPNPLGSYIDPQIGNGFGPGH
ncbi:MAG TPA: hypothetical protein VN805_15800 [Caulobacteraceae bacterium]|nr:hypothetical protein [Caulobacteraceae bacterium]